MYYSNILVGEIPLHRLKLFAASALLPVSMLCRPQEAGCKIGMVQPTHLCVSLLRVSRRHQTIALGLKRDVFPSCFPDQKPVDICLFFPYACYIPRSSYHPNNIWWRLDIMNHAIKHLSRAPCNFFPLRSIYLLQHPFSTTLSVWFCLNWNTKSHGRV